MKLLKFLQLDINALAGGGKPKTDHAAVAANAERTKQIETQNLENENKMRKYEYTSLFNEATRKARQEAEQAVTGERTQGMTDASKLLTDYQSQERRRLFEAKKGVGQVSEEDTAITAQHQEDAKALLDRGSDYWDAKRSVAGDKAYQGAKDKFLKEQGSEQDYVTGGSLFQQAETNKVQTTADKSKYGEFYGSTKDMKMVDFYGSADKYKNSTMYQSQQRG